MKKLGIYIHIPFCVRKCSYCDFYSVALNDNSEYEFIESVLNEIKGYKDKLRKGYTVDSIFFGGEIGRASCRERV